MGKIKIFIFIFIVLFFIVSCKPTDDKKVKNDIEPCNEIGEACKKK